MAEDVTLDEETVRLVSRYSREVTFNKGDIMQQAGPVCKHVYFILTGQAISYFSDFSGKTTTWFFHFNNAVSTVKNMFAVDYKSFLSGDPGTMTIEALTDIKALHFSRKDVDLLMQQSRIFEQWMRRLDEKSLIQTYDRLATLLTLPAAARYEKLLNTERHLLNMFSNYYVASYLGIAPQSLSRIRNTRSAVK